MFSRVQIWDLCSYSKFFHTTLSKLFLYGHQFAHGAWSCGAETGSPQTVAKKLEAQNSLKCHYTQLRYHLYWN